MRNLVVLQDSVHILSGQSQNSEIVSVDCESEQSQLFLLDRHGGLHMYSTADFLRQIHSPWNLNSAVPYATDSWFLVSVIAETGSIVCISHCGFIVSVRDVTTEIEAPGAVELEGDVDGGIATAVWSPDRSRLIIVTNKSSILCMTNQWEPLCEVPCETMQGGSTCTVSWRGDGEQFVLMSTDASDGIARARVFAAEELQLLATGRNVADGPGSVVRGLGSAAAYATNGSLIALHQQRVRGKHQIAFIERNGLRHGEFDLRCPQIPAGWGEWEVQILAWDLPSTLLAVGLRASCRVDGGETSLHAQEASTPPPGVVQLYYRGNYHWYLKQQWSGPNLTFVGFDAEIVGRMYLTMDSPIPQPEPGAAVDAATTWKPSLRIIDVAFDVHSSITNERSVAVVDGCDLLLTPMARHVVPPPMSKYKVSFAQPCRDVSFFEPISAAGESRGQMWGLISLCDKSECVLIYGEVADGRPKGQIRIDISDTIQRYATDATVLCSALLTLRSIAVAVVTDDANLLDLVIVGSCPSTPRSASVGDQDACPTSLSEDILLIIRINSTSGAPVHARVYSGLEGSLGRLASWPGDASSIAVGMQSSAIYQVRRLRPSEPETVRVALGIHEAHGTWSDWMSLPEPCSSFAVVSSTASQRHSDDASLQHLQRTSDVEFATIGLSSRNRLYCGETLIVAGASSFEACHSLGMLLYTTVGTRPKLHFVPISALFEIETLQAEDQRALETAEPRPLERGSRLVAVAEDQGKVVVQLPRGNLETFEPRPLVIMRARSLLDRGQLLDCLLLLRRQRVDLNFLVDYRPSIFLKHVASMCHSAIETNPETLSLFISSLEPEDVTAFKYPCLGLDTEKELSETAAALESIFTEESGKLGKEGNATVAATARGILGKTDSHLLARRTTALTSDTKVDTICQVVRDALLPLLKGEHASAALNPILCTFAKQRPPLLAEALALIRGVVSPTGRTASATALASGKVQAAIKYLAFLADGSQLFDAALGQCDFDMARAVARQCQMDPKIYLPLLARFETMGQGHAVGSWPYSLMRFAVNLHLKRFDTAVVAATDALAAFLDNYEPPNTAIDTMCAQLFQMIKEEDLYSAALPLIVDLESREKQGGPSGTPDRPQIVGPLLSRLRIAYGARCMAKQNYAEAVTAFLSATPPRTDDAVRAARALGDWHLTLVLASRYSSTLSADLLPSRLAQEIIAEFREVLEQGVQGDQGDDSAFASLLGIESTVSSSDSSGLSDLIGAGDGSRSIASPSNHRSLRQRARDAAQLCLDYFDDVESAVSILVYSKQWLPAALTALRRQRMDLFNEEVGAATRAAAVELRDSLRTRALRLPGMVAELRALWKDPDARLKGVADAEPALKKVLDAGIISKDENVLPADCDTRSEYSVASMRTDATDMSSRSRTRSISSSGSSTLSILSRASGQSAVSATPSASFSVTGIDHALLSRGRADANEAPGRKSERRQKRMAKKRARGEGRDLMGTRREGALCDELWLMAHVPHMARTAQEIVEALLLLSDPGDAVLAAELQRQLDAFIAVLCENNPPAAPSYPTEWLESRQMMSVTKFQWTNSSSAADTDIKADNFWRTAADGIALWQNALRRHSLG